MQAASLAFDTTAPSPSSDSSDTDAFNTVNARVYFGPLRSPEKDLIPLSPVIPQPGRSFPDSLRPFTPTPQLDLQQQHIKVDLEVSGHDMVAAQISRTVTPDNDDNAQDEPSSQLASRIISAHGNPSPPPTPPPVEPLLPQADISFTEPLFELQPLVDERRPTPGSAHAISETNTTVLVSLSPFAPLPASTDAPLITTPDNHLELDERVTSTSPHTTILDAPHATSSHALDRSLVAGDTALYPPPVESPVSQHPIHLEECSDSLVGTSSDKGVDNTASSTGSSDCPHGVGSSAVFGAALPLPITFVAQNGSKPSGTPLRRSPRHSSPRVTAPDVVRADNITPPGQDDIRSSPHKRVSKGKQKATEDTDTIEKGTTLAGEAEAIAHNRPLHPDQDELEAGLPHSTNLLPKIGVPPPQTPQKLPSRQGQSSVAFTTPLAAPPLRLPPTTLSTPTTGRTPGPRSYLNERSSSPFKLTLKPTALDDPHRTPARRIPIQQAINDGHPSPGKGIALNFGQTPGKGPSLHDTPARRVPLPEGFTPGQRTKLPTLRFGSAQLAGRSRSVEPQPFEGFGVKAKGRSNSVEPPPVARTNLLGSAPDARAPTRLNKLPFPVTSTSTLPHSIPEETESDARIPTKSILKQPTSRIPRIGAKPYARTQQKVTSKPITNEGRARDDVNIVEPPKVGSRGNQVVNGDPSGSTTTTFGFAPGTPARSVPGVNLKRKRETSETFASPTKPKTFLRLRQVPPTPNPPPEAAVATKSTTTKSTAKPASGTYKIRRVVEPLPEPMAASMRIMSPPPEIVTLQVQSTTGPPPQPAPSPSEAIEPPPQPIPSPSETNVHSPPPSSPVIQLVPHNEDPIGESHTISATRMSETTNRRTTRLRKPKAVASTFVADLLGEQEVPSQTRRKATNTSRLRSAAATETSFGLTAVALKALTSSNTLRNQHYISVKLETEVIRKEGARPDSPTTKVRTTLQRQQEDRQKQRMERATRRAQRGGGQAEAGETSATENEDQLIRDESPMPYTRGAGDDEDDEIMEFKSGPEDWGEDQATRRKRQVKWDRGLYTSIYLDEITLGARIPPKDIKIAKGCLAPAAKAVQLDTLGNHPNAELPLTDLVSENIIVKRFVYDNDPEAIPEIVTVKSTRSKAKKGKS